MERGRSEGLELLSVKFASIPFVFCKTVARVFLVELGHPTVAMDFGEDGSRTDGDRFQVTLHVAALREFALNLEFTIDHEDVRHLLQRRNGALHSAFGGVKNVDGVYLVDFRVPDGPADGDAADFLGK